MISAFMPPSKPNHSPSKLLSYSLPHKPSAYEIVLDENGCTNVDKLIKKLNYTTKTSTSKYCNTL
jgi:RNA:NAD 2'-phosphotransferase (TPT1/KptA family)